MNLNNTVLFVQYFQALPTQVEIKPPAPLGNIININSVRKPNKLNLFLFVIPVFVIHVMHADLLSIIVR